MDCGPILDIGIRANDHTAFIGTNRHMWPNTTSGSDGYIADDDSAGMHPRRRIYLRFLITELFNQFMCPFIFCLDLYSLGLMVSGIKIKTTKLQT